MTNPASIDMPLDTALWFASQGVRVFPIAVDSKVPPKGMSWQNTATRDQELIAKWYMLNYRGFNVGVVCDSLVVLDVDTLAHGKGTKDGLATLAKLEADNEPLPETLRVRTASGGLHLYFDGANGLGATFTKGVDKLGPGLDVQTGNAYLVGPKSRIGGKTYEIEHLAPIADLPGWLRELLRDRIEVVSPPAPPRRAGAPAEVNNRYVNAAITNELSRLRDLSLTGWNGPPWDQTTFQVACQLIEISNGDGSDYPLSAAYGDFMATAPTDAKFGPRQHEQKWNSALKKVGSSGRVFPTINRPKSPPIAPSSPPPREADPTEPPRTSDDYFGKHGLKTEMLANDVKRDFALGPDKELWLYRDGIFAPESLELMRRVTQALGDRYRPGSYSAVHDYVRALPGLKALNVEQPDPRYIILENGVYSWQENELRRHAPEYGAITKLPIEYDPEAACPEFDRYLSEVVPQDTISLVWEVIGYMLMFGNPLQRAVILQGPGGNGKSTFLRVLQALIGKQNISALSLRQISEDRFALAGLLGKTANLAGDIDSKYLGDASRFKQVVGGDLIEVERKYGQPFSFEPYAVPVFSANEFWKTGDTTHGYWRRWLPIPFPFPVVGKRPLNEADLFAESAGIFNRAMIGLRALMARGDFGESDSVTDLRDKMEAAADVLNDWFAEDTRIVHRDPADKGQRTPRTEVYGAFRDWCRESGHKGMSSTNFYKRLVQLGYTEAKVNGTRHFVGIVTQRRDTAAILGDV